MAGDLIALANGCRELIQQSLGGNRMRAGTEDAIQLLREALANMPDEPRSATVSRKQINDAADALAAGLEVEPASAAAWARLFPQLSERASTLADMAEAFAQEHGNAASSEMRTWADAARACIESHRRDAATFLPWTRMKSSQFADMSRRPAEQAPEWATLQPLFPTAPALVEAPEHFDTARDELGRLRERLAGDSSANAQVVARVDMLVKALNEAAAEAAVLVRRLAAIADTSESMAAAMDFTFLFDPARKLLSIGYRVQEGVLDEACYDLLASEARLASFVGIAKGDLPVEHWFHLDGADAGGPGIGAGFLVGLDVRIPDASAGNGAAGGKRTE